MIKFDNFKNIILDFDGVLTDNSVYVNENGQESVKCSRSDGLALSALRKLNFNISILSTEENKVVSERAKKLKIQVIQGVRDKEMILKKLSLEKGLDLNKTIYIGNDLNDYRAMLLCSLKCCPLDSHTKIKEISDVVFKAKGGNGVIRELTEEFLGIDLLKLI
tara:strand:+ start:858 stop:1346 length:489 start_codon:yes stop_codon:yes gene_type:complete